MKNISVLLITSLILSACSNQQERAQQELNERISRIENGLESRVQIEYKDSIIKSTYSIVDRMKELKVPGVSIAVLNNGIVEWAKGYGIADSSENRNVTKETLFQAGSISKPVAATRAHQLVELGLLDLDSNVNDFLTSWKLPDNEFTEREKVTLRRMLNHSAGLTVWGFPGYERDQPIPSIPDILDGKGNTDSVRVYKEPGGDWRYSGGGYTIMQQMITDVENQRFPEIMKKQVLNPLGMLSSTYENPLPNEYHSIAAAGYREDGTQVKGKWHVYPEMAAAGLWTTPSELVLWGKEIQDILQSQTDGLLKANTVNEMLSANEDDQGLGPFVLDLTFGHGGADEGFRAELLIWKETANAVVIMVNSDNGSIMREIMLSIVREYNLPDYTPSKRIFKEQSHEQLLRFVGTYDFQDNGLAYVVIKEDGLELRAKELTPEPIFLWPESNDTFFSKATGLRFNFNLNETTVESLKVAGLEAKKIE